ncbi:hypothetical protein [Pedobacter endophyticus]|uniref:DUF748 domain-containing protein n=1 Tax=Pedobacter endophyticus TaxID=2789740 RepID=A0A7U3Q3S7_9SPHI|nr:hypothetical protein [Pedobacter endophyticus]QPH38022.1 hypothetical protein IZT61_13020 [Pedobacter endophyticus]
MQATKSKRYKILKWITALLLVLFLILSAAAWYLNVKSRPLLTDRIKTLVYQSTDSLYTISFSRVSTNILTGNASLTNVKITPDTNRYKELIALKRAPNNLYTVSLKKLSVRHFHPLKLYRERKLQLNDIIFDKPEVLMQNKQYAFNEGRAPRPIKSPYAFISKSLAEFSIKSIRFKDASFKYVNKNVSNARPFLINDLNITLTDLLIDSTSADDPTRFYLLKDIVITLKNYVYHTPDKMYDIKVDKLDFRATTGKLRIDSFALAPRYSEMAFGKRAGYARERFAIKMNNILLNGIDLPLYISKQELWAKEMNIAQGYVSVFNNDSLRNKPRQSKIGKFPHQLLQMVEAPLLVQKIKLNNIDVSYAVYNDESDRTGKITFEHTSGTIKNATNLEKIKAINPIMEVNLTSYLFAQGKLDVNFKFDLTAKDGAFAYDGVLHSFNARVLNKITTPLGLVRVNRGSVDQLKFNFKANDLGAKGKVVFSYYDLSVALMKNDPTKDHLVKRGLLSFLANALIINSENPGPDGKLITADVAYDRPPGSSFFNLIWRSLFAGIKHSVGITEEKENEIKTHIANFKAMQKSHQQRKQRRLQRRERKERNEGR